MNLPFDLPYKCSNEICHKQIEKRVRKLIFLTYLLNLITSILLKYL